MLRILGRKMKLPFGQQEVDPSMAVQAPPPAAALAPPSVEPPAAANPSLEKPQLDLIVIPQSAMDAYPEDPNPLVGALVDYVNYLLRKAHYERDEIPVEAMQAFHIDFYLSQVLTGGHAKFVSSAGANLSFVIPDVCAGLGAMNEMDYLGLAGRMSVWLANNADLAKAQTGVEGGNVQELAALDAPFRALNDGAPLRQMLADWLADHEIVQVVDDADMGRVMEGIARLNGARSHRARISRIAGLAEKLNHPVHAGIGYAAGSAAPVEAVVAVGNGSMREVEGERKMCFVVRTSSGMRWATVEDEGVTLYERIEPEHPDMPENMFDASAEDTAMSQEPDIGPIVNSVAIEQVRIASRICTEVKAAAAIDLLLQECPAVSVLDAVTMRSAGTGPDGVLGASLMIVANRGALAATAIVTQNGARLLAEPSHDELISVSAAQIAAHQASYAADEAA